MRFPCGIHSLEDYQSPCSYVAMRPSGFIHDWNCQIITEKVHVSTMSLYKGKGKQHKYINVPSILKMRFNESATLCFVDAFLCSRIHSLDRPVCSCCYESIAAMGASLCRLVVWTARYTLRMRLDTSPDRDAWSERTLRHSSVPHRSCIYNLIPWCKF